MDGETKKYQIEPSRTLGRPGACGFQPTMRHEGVPTVEQVIIFGDPTDIRE
jgi:hypothetical protein